MLGLKWKAVNFENNVLSVSHAVKNATDEKGFSVKGENKLKRRASFRTLPLIPPIKVALQNEMAKRYGNENPVLMIISALMKMEKF